MTIADIAVTDPFDVFSVETDPRCARYGQNRRLHTDNANTDVGNACSVGIVAILSVFVLNSHERNALAR